jgi:hypothetical protein
MGYDGCKITIIMITCRLMQDGLFDYMFEGKQLKKNE